jgi:hypothetical protein
VRFGLVAQAVSREEDLEVSPDALAS